MRLLVRVSKTRTGRYIYAVGGNSDSAYNCGIDTAKVQIMACMINSVFIFLAALFFVGQTGRETRGWATPSPCEP